LNQAAATGPSPFRFYPRPMRLNRYLAACGLGSRRSCEQLIGEGRVFLNGEEVRDLATQVGASDEVVVDGRKVKAQVETTLILNKPPGFLCTRHDELEDPRREAGIRETVYALLPAHFQALHYVGRLDKDSEGLLILTNSGELTEKLTHPRFGVEKEYLVALDRVFRGEEDRQQLLKGMMIEGGFAKAVGVDVVEPRVVALTLTQGIKRQIRLMFEALGYRVQRLQRVRIGAFTAPELKSGRWRLLSAAEAKQLLARHTPPKPRPAQAREAARKAAAPAKVPRHRTPREGRSAPRR
jgi:23S rRNA pseudouridine2605 synthase